MNWRCADPVPRVLPLKSLLSLSGPTHRQLLSFPPPPPYSPLCSSHSSLSRPLFLALSETVAIISILLLYYNSSGNVRSFSRVSRLPPNPPPFIIVFCDISRFFLPRPLQNGQLAPRLKLSLSFSRLKPRRILIRQMSTRVPAWG